MALWGKQDALAVTGTTIGVTNASAAVTGIGTAFTTQMKHGDTLIIDGVKYKVLSITSDTALTLSSVYEGSTDAELVVASVKIQQSPKFLNTTEKRNTLGIDTAEDTAGGDNVVTVAVASGGARYLGTAPAVTFSGGGGASAAATATIAGGVVTGIAVTNVGSSYETVPTVAIAKPARIIPTSGVTIATEQITYATHGLVSAESVKYFHGGGTAITGLTNDTEYFVSALGLAANTFRLAASAAAAPGRANLTAPVATSGTGGQFTCDASTLAVNDHVVISGTNAGTGTITGYTTGTIYEVSAVTGTSPNVTGFTLVDEAGSAIVTTAGTLTGLSFKPYTIVMISGTGNNAQYFEIQAAADQATAIASKGLGADDDGTTSGAEKVAAPGWVLKTVGTGGRAGRVQYETLVAGRSLITGDAADDLEAPDA
jgi:hypothetical protein